MIIKKIDKFFENENNCIIFSSDAEYVPITSVAIQSIIDKANSKNQYDIIIIHKGIGYNVQNTVKDMAVEYDNISIRFYDIGYIFENIHLYTSNREHFSSSAYYRLAIPYILEDSYQVALYMDGDMIVQEDIYEIFNVDLCNNLIGAVKDYWGICNCYIPGDSRREYRESIGLKDIDEYVISATILFNLKLYRETYSLDYVLSLIGSYNWVQHDQDVINILCKGAIHYLNATWGYMSDYGNNHYLPQYLLNEIEEIIYPRIIHYGGRRKPTTTAYIENDIVFWKIAQKSPYFEYLINNIKSLEYKIYLFKSLFEKKVNVYNKIYTIEKYCGAIKLGDLNSGRTIFRKIAIEGNKLHIEGAVSFFWADSESDIGILLEINGVKHNVKNHYREDVYVHKQKIVASRAESFIFDYYLKDNLYHEIKVIAVLDGIEYERNNITYGKFCTLTNDFKNSYYTKESWIITNKNKRIIIKKCSDLEILKYEKRLQQELLKKGTAQKKAVIVRIIFNLLKCFKRKPIWIISDRLNKADENGEAFFKYLNNNRKHEIKSFFVINKDSPDYTRLKKYGQVIPTYSYRHKMIHLMSDVIISSQTDNVWRNPFRNYASAYSDIIYDKKFIFLQHGIISNDLSRWFSRKEQNIDGFVTSTQKEKLSILDGKYNYLEDEVWLTGLPRFDYLENTPKKMITVLPTWRLYLTSGQNNQTGDWIVKSNFKDSEYAVFYRNLMNNSTLKQALKKYGYEIQFKAHPAFTSNIKDFCFDENVKIITNEKTYREIYAESNMIITDYSSAIYDFIYLKKPIIYSQFDSEDFFSGKHSYDKGDINYENDGFGEVEYTLEDTVERIIEYMENDCQLKDKYRERIDKFFMFNDKNNCQRVYERILEIGNER